MALLPLFVGGVPYVMSILIMCLIWAVVASCWDVIMGFAGIFSFGQVAFFVIGAYCSGILSIDYAVPPVLAIPLAGLFTAAMGVIVGLPCLRLAGPYVALVTFGVHMALTPTLRGKIGIALGTGGSKGLLTIPPLSLFGFTFDSAHMIPTFYLTLLLSLACALVIMLVIKSYWGTAFLALKDSQDFSMSLGVNAFKYKLMVFALTSFLTGIIGAYYAHFTGVLSFRMVRPVALRHVDGDDAHGRSGPVSGGHPGGLHRGRGRGVHEPVGAYRDVVMGGLAVILVLALPKGIMGLIPLGEKRPVRRGLTEFNGADRSLPGVGLGLGRKV